MSNLAGMLSGTKIIVEIEQTLGIGDYIQVPGETSHTLTTTNELIDVTNKSLADYRCWLEGEGRQLLDLTIEAINNSDAAYQLLYSASDSRSFVRIRRVTGARTVTSQYMIASVSDNPTQNAAVSDSFSLSSTGAITVS